MCRIILFFLIFIYQYSHSQEIIKTFNGISIKKNDTIYAGKPCSNGFGYYKYVKEIDSEKKLKCFDKLLVLNKVEYYGTFLNYRAKEVLLCKKISSEEKFYVAINEAVNNGEIYTDFIKYGYEKNYYDLEKHHYIYDYNSSDIIYLWYKQSILPEYFKIKKYIEIEYIDRKYEFSNDFFNKIKKEINTKIVSIDTNKIYSMYDIFRIDDYNENTSKLNILPVYEFKKRINDFISIKCNNYPKYFTLDINKYNYNYLKNELGNSKNIHVIINYKVLEKSIYDDDDDIRIKIISIDIYDNIIICNSKILSNYYGTVYF